MASHQTGEDAGRQKTESDAVAAIAIGGKNAGPARHGTDQRQPVAGLTKGTGPDKFRRSIGPRPQGAQFCDDGIALGRGGFFARFGFDNVGVVLAADNDAAILGGAGVGIGVGGFPDQHAISPELARLPPGGNCPGGGDAMVVFGHEIGQDVAGRQNDVARFNNLAIAHLHSDATPNLIKGNSLGIKDLRAVCHRIGNQRLREQQGIGIR